MASKYSQVGLGFVEWRTRDGKVRRLCLRILSVPKMRGISLASKSIHIGGKVKLKSVGVWLEKNKKQILSEVLARLPPTWRREGFDSNEEEKPSFRNVKAYIAT